MLSALRWVSLSLALALGLIEHLGRRAAVAGRRARRLHAVADRVRPSGASGGGGRRPPRLLLEVAVGVAVVEATGFARSPFLITLGVATVIAGFAGGLRVVSGLALIAGLAVALPSRAPGLAPRATPTRACSSPSSSSSSVWPAASAATSWRTSRQAREGLTARVEHLSEVNELLLDLHRATEREVTPMHVEGAARWALERLDEMFTPPTWPPSSSSTPPPGPGTSPRPTACAPAPRDAPSSFPAPCTAPPTGPIPSSSRTCDQGLNYRSRWGLYCPMHARDEIVGRAGRGGQRRTRPGVRPSGAASATWPGPRRLAIDNARWLERIHTLGMEQERTRLARELHDHIGQSVVYLGFEIDRLVELNHGARRAGRPPGAARRPARPRRGAARHARRPAQRRHRDPGRRRRAAVVPRPREQAQPGGGHPRRRQPTTACPCPWSARSGAWPARPS